MANPDTYNDPYDCSFKVVEEKAMAEFLKTEHGKFIARTAKHDASVIAKYVNDSAESVRKIRDTMKICSFSDVSDSLLMWGHYAEEHKGFCIEYDLEVLDRNHEIRRNLYPVIYSSCLYDMTEYINGATDAFAREYNPYAPLFSVLRKFEGWRYENEWRLVLFPHMLKPDFAQKLPKASRVMLGSRMKELRKKAIQAICMDRNIDVWEMSIESEKFELVAKPYVAHSPFKR